MAKVDNMTKESSIMLQLKNILWHSNQMDRNEISDPTYYTNGNRSRDQRLMRDMKESFKKDLDKL